MLTKKHLHDQLDDLAAAAAAGRLRQAVDDADATLPPLATAEVAVGLDALLGRLGKLEAKVRGGGKKKARK